MLDRTITTPARAALLLLCTALVAGCEVNSPELPSFETSFVLPLGTERLEMIDAVDDEDYLVVNGDGSIGFLIEGAADSLNYDLDLSASVPNQDFSQGLGSFNLPDPAPLSYAFELGDIWAPAAGVNGANVVVPPFPIDITSSGQALPDLESATLTSGMLSVTLTNELPVPIGANSGPNKINLRLENADNGDLIVLIPFTEITPGSSQNQLANLVGKMLPSSIAVRLNGGSPGSSGQLVTVNGTDRVAIDATFSNLLVSSATAVVGSQSFSTTFESDLPAGYEITQAVIKQGDMTLDLANNMPVPCTARITWLQVRDIDNNPLSRTVPLIVGQSVSELLDFAGFNIRASGAPLTSLTAQVHITSNGSGGQPVSMSASDGLNATLNASTIAFSSLTGLVPEISVPLEPVVENVDLPEELDGLELTAASISLHVTSSAGIPADIAVTLVGTAADGSTRQLDVNTQVLPALDRAPSTTTIVLDQTNSTILDFLNNLPETITLAGDVSAGGGQSGTVHDDDFALITWTIAAPLEVVITGATIDADPSELDLDEDLRDRIHSHARGALLRSEVFNHMPMAIELYVSVAENEAALENAPLLTIGPLIIAAAEVDPITHIVSQGVTSSPVLSLTAAEAQMFGRPGLFTRVQAILPSTSGLPIRIMSTDYLEFRGVVEMEVLVDDEF